MSNKMLNIPLLIDSIVEIEVWKRENKFLLGSQDDFVGKVQVDLKEVGITHHETITYKAKLERVAKLITLSFAIKSYGIDISPADNISEGSSNSDSMESVEIEISDDETNEVDDFLEYEKNAKNKVKMKKKKCLKRSKKKRRYDVLKQIGAGGFGEVFLIKNKENKLFALKKIYCRSEKEVNRAMGEVFFLQKVNHENIIEYFDVFFEIIAFGPYKYSICFTMEYFELKDLEQYLQARARDNMNYLKERVVISYFKQMAKALNYLSNCKLIHRDLKPANIFMRNRYKELIIGDFGLTKVISNETSSITKSGTPKYQSPESFTSESLPTEAADLWSLGCTFYQIMNLKYDKTFYLEIYKNPKMHEMIRNGLSKNYSSELIELVIMLLQKEPKSRIRASDLLTKLSLIEESKSYEVEKGSKLTPFKVSHDKDSVIGVTPREIRSLTPESPESPSSRLKIKVKNLKYQGGKYSGELNYVTNLPHGKGTLRYSRKEYYVGGFRNGEFCGKGKLIRGDALYDGSWKGGLKHGYGRMLYGGGSSFEGEWKNNKRNGLGEKINLNDTYYYGEWKSDKPLGEIIQLGEIGNWLKSFQMQKYTKMFFDNKIFDFQYFTNNEKEAKKIITRMKEVLKDEDHKDIDVILKEMKKKILEQRKKNSIEISDVILETRKSIARIVKDENTLNQIMKEMEAKIRKGKK